MGIEDILIRTANMTPLQRSIITVALTWLTSTTLAYGSSAAGSTTSSSASTPSAVEVDVIFPIHNATYNVTESLPIVFALQNLTAAAALGPFAFSWDIMPYGHVGEDQVPGGITYDSWLTTFTTTSTITEPYILVNQTDVQKWPLWSFYPNGLVFALQWYISWDAPIKTCNSSPLGQLGWLFFNININGPEPDLGNLTGQCPQLGTVYEIKKTASNRSCSAVVSNKFNGTGDPCAVNVNESMVGNISSAVQSLITASAAASSAATALASATGTFSPAPHNLAVTSDVPLQYVSVVGFLIGSLQMAMFS